MDKWDMSGFWAVQETQQILFLLHSLPQALALRYSLFVLSSASAWYWLILFHVSSLFQTRPACFCPFLTLPDSRPFAGLAWPQIVKDHKNIARVQHCWPDCWPDDITTLNSLFCLLIFFVFHLVVFFVFLAGSGSQAARVLGTHCVLHSCQDS